MSLKAFLGSPRYGSLARQFAEELLTRTKNPMVFADLFQSAFGRLDWGSLPAVAELDRTLNAVYVPLTQTKNPVTEDGKLQATAIYLEIKFLGEKIGTLVRNRRPPDIGLDLHSVALWDCDFSNADLTKANLAGFVPSRVVLRGADLTDVTQFQGGYWKECAWWQASRMSRPMLDYLRSQPEFQYDSRQHYGATQTSEQDYNDGVLRLAK
jgi:Pentapeptide repeats (8 copies)